MELTGGLASEVLSYCTVTAQLGGADGSTGERGIVTLHCDLSSVELTGQLASEVLGQLASEVLSHCTALSVVHELLLKLFLLH